MNRNKKKKNPLLLYAIVGFIVILCVFGLIYVIKPRTCQTLDILTICPRIADVPHVPALTVVPFGGSTTFAPLNKPDILDRIKKAHPQFKLQHINPEEEDNSGAGSIKGIQWLIEGTHNLTFAQSSRPIKKEQRKEADDKGVKLQEIPVAYDITAIFVNAQLITPEVLKGLTIEQVKEIFTGKVKNWQRLGGPDRDITIIKRVPNVSGTVDSFQEKVLNNQPYGANNREVRTTSQAIEAIRTSTTTPGGIAFATASEVINQKGIRILPIAKQDKSNFNSPCTDNRCTSVNKNLIVDRSYPDQLTRTLYVVIKDQEGLNKQAGIAYVNMLLSDEGQKWVEQAEFVPFRIVPRP